MSDREYKIKLKYFGKQFSYVLFFLVLIFKPASSFADSLSGKNSITFQINQPPQLPLIILFSGLLIIVTCVAAYFFIRNNIFKRDLLEKESKINQLEDSLSGLQNKLKSQKEIILNNKPVSEEPDRSDVLYRIMVQSANDGIAFYDLDWNLKYANPAFYNMLGITGKTQSTLNYDELIHPEDKYSKEVRDKLLQENGFYEGEFRLKHGEGHYLNFSSRSSYVRSDNGEVLGSLSIIRDTTELKHAHEELIKANYAVETSNKLKSSFLANISHEIRTPLNSVVGFSNLLLSDDISREIREEYIEHINHNSEKLLQIIGDIIDLSRLESSQIEITYEETSLSSIISEIIEEARQVIKRNEKPIVLYVKNEFQSNGDQIFTDRIWLKRVLNHLMDNAVKFTLDGSIEFMYLRDGENIVFKIKDTGIGIKKENLNRIFEEFLQEVDGHHRPFEGLGIGLTLAKEVVERMGGRIYVQSEKGIGSEFSFSIPYRPAGTPKIKVSQSGNDLFIKPIDWSSKKCLLVDDNKDVLIYLNRILLDTGVTILTARSGYEAIEIIKSTPDIDVVLLDMQMPEMNGIEATQEIRKIRNNLPIIAQTAFVFEDEKDIIIEAGCDACLIKPIRKDHLLTVMSSFVKSS